MKILRHGSLFIVLGIVSYSYAAGNQQYMSLTPGLVRISEGVCRGLAEQPYFVPELVIGKPWRVYYTWNMKMDDKCVDVHFQTATPAIIRRINYEMFRSMVEQPAWDTAALLMTTGKSRQEMLLFPDDNNVPGRFVAVPNGFSDIMPGGRVPLLRFQMKLMRGGRFLVFMDCQVGIATVSARFDEPPYRMDVDSVASELAMFLGQGDHACLVEHNSNENILAPEEETPRPPLISHV